MKKPTVKYTNGEIGGSRSSRIFCRHRTAWCAKANVKVTLTLQLLFCFEVRALGGGLVSSTPE